MRNPIDVLNSLRSKSKNPDYHYERLYRNLYNAEFYTEAYQNIYAKPGNMTAGTDGKTVDGMSMERIEALIASMKDHSYQPYPARRTYIKKKNGKLRPLGIPSFNDKLVQEIIRMILESIYEPTFSNRSHGFRPDRSCHTALQQLKANFTAVKWFIEGDITSFFDNINHAVLVGILRRRIHDEYFISLIWKFLKAGYIEDWTFYRTYSGTPQGSIISPILSNIYLNEFDRFMERYMESFKAEKIRAKYKPYWQLHEKIRWLKDGKILPEMWENMGNDNKKEYLKNIRYMTNEKIKMPTKDPMDSNYRRLQYLRYADDWICGVIGSKEDAEMIKADVKKYLSEELKLELSEEKTLITNAHDKARFLGFDICTSQSQQTIEDKNGNRARYQTGRIKLYVPREKWQKKLTDYSALKIKYQNGKEIFVPCERTYLINSDDLEILNQYNAEIRGIYNYYRIADNASVLGDFYYVMKYSMFKTFAAKYKTRISKIRKKYGYKRFGVKYPSKSGKAVAYLYDGGFRHDGSIIKMPDVDVIPLVHRNLNRTSLISRLKAQKCEWCGAEDVPIEMHHVRKIKDLKDKTGWEIVMIGRKRKTMALCPTCHDKLHAGKLD
ncbi:MAG TPA: reverse transcriptase domain-containing protein [Clostridiales bacterium]|nr:reverse transcriptase domain-containing protein [Clostridiales bacterium]